MPEPRALTAGQQDHSDPWQYAGADADAPVNPVHPPSLRRSARRAVKRARKLAPRRRKAAPWRNCNASLRLVEKINGDNPRRDKTSDGTIGNAEHAARSSDHNPWVIVAGMGVVRARDVDVDGINAAAIVEALRKLGQAGDPRLAGGGYVIFNRRITTPDFSGWKVYTGSNPHDHHFHVSFSLKVAGFDSNAPWTWGGGAPPPPAGEPWRQLPPVRDRARSVQGWYNRFDFRPPLLPVISPLADNWGPQSEAALRKVQARYGLEADGIDGPKTKKVLWDLGWRG